MCRISSANCFISGFTASQSTLFCKAKYSVLHFAHKPSVSLRICFQSFSLRYTLKSILKKHFQLVSDFIFLPPSFCFTLRFCSYESTKDKLSLYHIWTFASRFAGCFAKNLIFFFSSTENPILLKKTQKSRWQQHPQLSLFAKYVYLDRRISEQADIPVFSGQNTKTGKTVLQAEQSTRSEKTIWFQEKIISKKMQI